VEEKGKQRTLKMMKETLIVCDDFEGYVNHETMKR
jgi:hypothetical protein